VSDRIYDLIGAHIVGISVSHGFVTIDVEHKGCDDDAATILFALDDIAWRYSDTTVEEHEP
jgi:hypothetical protein